MNNSRSSNYPNQATSEENFLKDTSSLVISFLKDSQEGNFILNQATRNTKFLSHFCLTENTQAKNIEEIKKLVRQYINTCIRTSHPQWFNQLWGGVSPISVAAEMITAATNKSMYTHEVAPVSTVIEQSIINKMGKLAGFENIEGQFTTGGSNGNLMALKAALHYRFPQIKSQGLLSLEKQPCAFVSEEAHYSLKKAIQILGLGSNNLIGVKTNSKGEMIPVSLVESINSCIDKGKEPFFIGATAGTTVKGAFDPLVDLSHISKKYKTWFHVDGAWGGAVLLSEKYKYLIKGLESADSFVWDAHKMMGVPLVSSALIFNNHQGLMFDTFSSQDTGYIFHNTNNETPTALQDLGPSTMHCGRRDDSFKLWLNWHYLGDEGWEKRIDQYFSLAEYAEKKVLNSQHLFLLSERSFSNICFSFRHSSGKLATDKWINLLRSKLLEQGKYMVNMATINGYKGFRLVICNPYTQKEHIDNLFNDLLKLAKNMPDE